MDKKIFGHVDTSFVDFQGKYSIVLYFSGCQLRCPYCFNKEMVFGAPKYSINDVLGKYKRLFKMLPNLGVVLTGGEPTINESFDYVYDLFSEYPLALHTNGLCLPKDLESIKSVVIGLKGNKDLYLVHEKDYPELFKFALDYYSSVPYKEIRAVKYSNKIDEFYYKTLEKCGPIVNEYKINFVEDNRYESIV